MLIVYKDNISLSILFQNAAMHFSIRYSFTTGIDSALMSNHLAIGFVPVREKEPDYEISISHM